MSIGSRIKERREELGITQTELAKMIGVTKGAIGNYETDANSPKAATMFKVFSALKCDANYLYQDDIGNLQQSAITSKEQTLLKIFRIFNDEGKEKLINYADDLRASGKYTK